MRSGTIQPHAGRTIGYAIPGTSVSRDAEFWGTFLKGKKLTGRRGNGIAQRSRGLVEIIHKQ